jgi:diguanylate cyclase (GGDEF)-like protein
MLERANLTIILAFLGITLQLTGELLLVVLFVLLRRYVVRRGYFGAWMLAWACGAIAIAAIAIRYMVLPRVISGAPNQVLLGGLYLVYQLGKLGYLGLLVTGTAMYVTGSRLEGPRRGLAVIAVSYAVASLIGSGMDLNRMVVWQAPVAVVALGACSALLFTLPPSRRSLGSIAGGSAFAGLATLWLLYGIAFAAADTPRIAEWSRLVVRFNPYFDLMLNTSLGFAMVVLLMEDAKREVDDAQAELRVAHDQLQRAALYDTLTDSLNRRAFTQGVGLEMARGTFGTVVIADLDNLKAVNDQHGHAAGDRLLRQCADLLRSALRPYDRLYRWGGDEFLLVIPSARGAEVAIRLNEVLGRAEPLVVGSGHSVVLQVSLGAADYTSAEQMEASIEAADEEMYRNKSSRKSPELGVRAVNIPSAAVRVRL